MDLCFRQFFTVSDVSTMLSNNSVDLNLGTTVGGLAILTEVDDSIPWRTCPPERRRSLGMTIA